MTYGTLASSDPSDRMADNSSSVAAENVHSLTPTGHSSAQAAVVNLLNTIVGAGLLAMPFALKQNGIVLGILVILISGFTAGMGLYLQAKCIAYVAPGSASFFALAKITYPSAAMLFDLAIAIKCFGVGCSYLIIAGNLTPQIMNAFPWVDGGILVNRTFWISVSMALVGPLSFLRKMDSLKYTSVIALVSFGYLVLLVIGSFILGDFSERRGEINFAPQSASAVLSTLPIVVFGYTCHQNMFSILNELKFKSEGNVRTLIGSSIFISAFSYIVVGITGYLTFGNNIGDNIVGAYPDSVSSTIGRIAIVVLVVFSYPLQCHPCRASVYHIYAWFTGTLKESKNTITNTDSDSDGTSRPPSSYERINQELCDEEEDTPAIAQIKHAVSAGPATQAIPTVVFIVLTSIILVLSFLLAISVTSLEKMLAFVGATGSTSISFILPGFFGYKLLDKPVGFHKAEGIDIDGFNSLVSDSLLQKLSLVLCLWGLLIMFLCLTVNIWLLF
ncbi:hypothetical protein NADFUDRAFT_45437 [Nadsonia fulvescens var. elongata DSM 6958]|uniref:Amino acid transporter transmembrane domain-containing protein n=1 Tax=Nadsonia fulvescens var. elongata DSM 6958 TaxID=857566 RepID=A0A1E3PQU7_9ASCO|nr:hypothetical protein NADFUDRAFT_45437 [Nadsonia fulvescens var. elongata DSM 6958]